MTAVSHGKILQTLLPERSVATPQCPLFKKPVSQPDPRNNGTNSTSAGAHIMVGHIRHMPLFAIDDGAVALLIGWSKQRTEKAGTYTVLWSKLSPSRHLGRPGE
jgi:hypothetical protein